MAEFMELGAGGWDSSHVRAAGIWDRSRSSRHLTFSTFPLYLARTPPTSWDGAAHIQDESSLLPSPKPAWLTLAISPTVYLSCGQPEKVLHPESPGGVSFQNLQCTYVCRISQPWNRTPSLVLKLSTWTSKGQYSFYLSGQKRQMDTESQEVGTLKDGCICYISHCLDEISGQSYLMR